MNYIPRAMNCTPALSHTLASAFVADLLLFGTTACGGGGEEGDHAHGEDTHTHESESGQHASGSSSAGDGSAMQVDTSAAAFDTTGASSTAPADHGHEHGEDAHTH